MAGYVGGVLLLGLFLLALWSDPWGSDESLGDVLGGFQCQI